MITSIITIRLKIYGNYPHDFDQPKHGLHVLLEPRALVRSVQRGEYAGNAEGGYADISMYGERLFKTVL
jgi:hypothetical protein